jgi:nucleotide-binding universal stress UspA family protein
MTPSVQEQVDQERLIRPSHILVATDLDDLEQLTPHIVAQAKAAGSPITLVHVVEPNDCRGANPRSGVPTCQRAKQESGKLLEAWAKEFEKQGISCSWTVTCGLAAAVLLEKIRVTGATRLIMASHGRGKVGQFLMGSVAKQTLGSCPIPVFMVPPQCREGHREPRRILHAVSLRDDYRATAGLAIGIAGEHRAALSFLHVFTANSSELPAPLHWSSDLLAEIAPGHRSFDSPIGVVTKFGDLVHEIVNEAKRSNADWIVMGVKNDFGVMPMEDCLAYRVMAISHCPVLAIWHHSGQQNEEVVNATNLVAVE